MNNYIYDIESFPNVFTMMVKHHESGQYWCFEISERGSSIVEMWRFMNYLQRSDSRMIGFNNIAFDYPILHFILNNYQVTAQDINTLCVNIIKADHEDRFDHIIWDDDRLVPQLDLLKIHHFDNVAKFTSLKVLEFNMLSENIQDLPFPPGTILTVDQIPTLISYNKHDVDETEKFFLESLDMIKFREYLSEKYDRNFLNHNDTKIGKDFFIMELEKAYPGSCYHKEMGRRQPRQTPRRSIAFKDVIFPYVRFEQPEFNRVLQWFESTTITETKKAITDLSCEVAGFTFDFGTGGIHGSISSSIVRATDDDCILDLDVTSYYPSLAIANRIFPEHLGEKFCDIYSTIKSQRVGYKKGSPENAMLKLALNGVFGDSNNKYSPFYDPNYTMGITVNGQLLLCMLAEQMIKIHGLQIIQINTDGLTVKCGRKWLPHIEKIKLWWSNMTGLDLEEAFYSRFFVRDVNNYIAEYEGGKVKRKGAYEYDLGWHQNRSALVIPKAVESVLLNGGTVEDYIHNHDDIFDFMLRTKVPRSSRLVLDEKPVQNVTRYYISNTGGALIKIMNPLKGKTEERRIGINVGWLVTECNNMGKIDRTTINFDYYVKEAKKLIDPLAGR